jgi:lipoprotein NlpD
VSLTRAIAAAGLCCFIIGGCASDGPYQPATYVVRPQDTLYSIAWRHNLDYRTLAKWNNIGTDYRVSIGQVLVLQPSGEPRAPKASPPAASAGVRNPRASNLPSVGKPVPFAEPPAASAAPSGAQPAGGSGQSALAPGSTATKASAGPLPGSAPHGPEAHGPEPIAAPALNGNSAWVWPTDRLSAPRPVPGGGILLLGRLGQDVRAAGSGRVVYTGSGLRGYGNLIIIKHGDTLLSSYAHNRELLVREGQDVAAGQVIAHMGMGPHQISALYFEIRVNGKPTDPLRYLRAAP